MFSENGGFSALERLRDEGKIGAIGCGLNLQGNGMSMVERYEDTSLDFFLMAGGYTLLDQTAMDNGTMAFCDRKNVGVVCGSPFNSGILVTGVVPGAMFQYAEANEEVRDKVARISSVCADHGVPLAAAALQFPLGWKQVASVIPGVQNASETLQNADWMRCLIPQALWEELKASGVLRADAPVPS